MSDERLCPKCGLVMRMQPLRGKNYVAWRCNPCIAIMDRDRRAEASRTRKQAERPPPDAWPAFSFGPHSDWGRCYTAFLAQLQSESTLNHYRPTLELFFTTAPARTPDEYTREDVLTFLNSGCRAPGREGKTPSAGTYNNRLSTLSSFYHFCASFGVQSPEDGKIYPLLRVLPPTAGLKHVQRDLQYKALSDSELRAFFAAIGPAIGPDGTPDLRAMRDACLFKLYFWTARRKSEILDLRLKDISHGVIIDGMTRREAILYQFRGKGRKGMVDTQEMPPEAAAALLEWLRVSGKLEHGQPEDPIFTALEGYHNQYTYDPGRPLCGNTVWVACKHYSKVAGLDYRRVSIHSFRHTAAKVRFEISGDLLAVQRLLRHANIATTYIYIASLAGVADPTAAALSSRFGDL